MKPLILVSTGIFLNDRGLWELRLPHSYDEAIIAAGGIPIIPGDKDEESLAQLAELADGLLLSGGVDIDPKYYGKQDKGLCSKPDLWRDELELKLCRLFEQRKKPILGICRGCQTLAVYFGGTLVQDIPSELGYPHPNHSYHTVTAEEGSTLAGILGTEIATNSYHHQCIQTVGPAARVTSWSENGAVAESIEHDSLPILGVQWHPERMLGREPIDPDCSDMTPLFDWFVGLCRKERNV